MKNIIFIIIIIVITVILKPPTHAQSQNCGGGSQPRTQGLVTTTDLAGKFSTTGGCVVDPKTAFVPFKIPTYEDLKSLYFTQSKATKQTIINLPAAITDKTVYYAAGNLTIDVSPQGSGTAVIFIEGTLSINSNLSYGSNTAGLVFVVKRNVNIDPRVTQVNALIMAEGIIYTAAAIGTSCTATSVTASPLTINGSLISINQADSAPIKFCRTLSGTENQTTPAEKINHQVKYLVILRDLLSDTWQKWSEIP